MKTFLLSLLSRKFLIALGTILVFVANKQYDQALITALGYMGINIVDTKINTVKEV